MSSDRQARGDLRRRFLAFMDDPHAERFEDLALDLFRRQWSGNEAYRGLCVARGIDPESVRCVEDIPAASTLAFKTLVLSTGPAARIFRTSGTTRGGEHRGAHHMVELDLYRQVLRRQFKRFVLPDRHRMRLLIFTPSPEQAPDSSLSFMMGDVFNVFGGPESAFLFTDDGIETSRLIDSLRTACEAGVPVALLGTAFGLVQAIDVLSREDLRFHLPAGSRIMDTGGFKGRSREISRADLRRAYKERFGIAKGHVVNEYGMTELSSQFYDASLGGGDPEVKLGPHWVRTSVIDPETGRELPSGRPGLLRHVDLANLDSVAAVETEDIGVQRNAGFVLLGRAEGAEPRGCSLAVEDLRGEMS